MALVKVDEGITQADFEVWEKDHPNGYDVVPSADAARTQIVYAEQVKDGLPLVARQLNAKRFMTACSEIPKDGQTMPFGSLANPLRGQRRRDR